MAEKKKKTKVIFREAKPDDPIFREGWTISTPKKTKEKK